MISKGYIHDVETAAILNFSKKNFDMEFISKHTEVYPMTFDEVL